MLMSFTDWIGVVILTLYVDASSNLPVRYITESFEGDYTINDFTYFSITQPNPTVFAIPSFCNTTEPQVKKIKQLTKIDAEEEH